MQYIFTFDVTNPSPYERSDYVQINLKELGVPDQLNEANLCLYRQWDTYNLEPVPYQIDHLTGRDTSLRVLSFLSRNTPSGPEDYSKGTARFVLKEETPQHFPPTGELSIGYYYRRPAGSEPRDGYNDAWFDQRVVDGVKFSNAALEIYFSLVRSRLNDGVHPSYAGSATSVLLREAERHTGAGEMLSPFEDDSEKRWGQLTEVAYFPLPWEYRWFHRFRLLDQDYDLVWARHGPVRAVITMKSQRMMVPFDGSPFLPGRTEIGCNLYRVLSFYPGDSPFYVEELFTLTADENLSLNFRPYYRSVLNPVLRHYTTSRHFENIPDYFGIWQYWTGIHRGYCFASDAHVRGLEILGKDIFWRLPTSHAIRTVHLFAFHIGFDFDPFAVVGHTAWYEKVFKPLAPTDFRLRFPPVLLKEDVRPWPVSSR